MQPKTKNIWNETDCMVFVTWKHTTKSHRVFQSHLCSLEMSERGLDVYQSRKHFVILLLSAPAFPFYSVINSFDPHDKGLPSSGKSLETGLLFQPVHKIGAPSDIQHLSWFACTKLMQTLDYIWSIGFHSDLFIWGLYNNTSSSCIHPDLLTGWLLVIHSFIPHFPMQLNHSCKTHVQFCQTKKSTQMVGRTLPAWSEWE